MQSPTSRVLQPPRTPTGPGGLGFAGLTSPPSRRLESLDPLKGRAGELQPLAPLGSKPALGAPLSTASSARPLGFGAAPLTRPSTAPAPSAASLASGAPDRPKSSRGASSSPPLPSPTSPTSPPDQDLSMDVGDIVGVGVVMSPNPPRPRPANASASATSPTATTATSKVHSPPMQRLAARALASSSSSSSSSSSAALPKPQQTPPPPGRSRAPGDEQAPSDEAEESPAQAGGGGALESIADAALNRVLVDSFDEGSLSESMQSPSHSQSAADEQEWEKERESGPKRNITAVARAPPPPVRQGNAATASSSNDQPRRRPAQEESQDGESGDHGESSGGEGEEDAEEQTGSGSFEQSGSDQYSRSEGDEEAEESVPRRRPNRSVTASSSPSGSGSQSIDDSGSDSFYGTGESTDSDDPGFVFGSLSDRQFAQKQSAFKIHPRNFGVKFNPPQIALQYDLMKHGKVVDTRVHIMPLQWLRQGSDVIKATAKLFKDHSNYLDPLTIQIAQIKKLVQRVQSRLPPESNGAPKPSIGHSTASPPPPSALRRPQQLGFK